MTAATLPETRAGRLAVERDGHVAWIVIDRPAKRNALSPQMWAALPGLVAQLDADPSIRVIGLRGAGGTFSAGADITEILDCLTDPATGLPTGGLLTEAERALAAVHKPTIAALDGFCMGGAWMLAGACDLRLAARSLRIGLTPSRIGIIFPESGIDALVRLVGPGVASYLLMTGDTVTAEDAERWGMLTRVVEDIDFQTRIQITAHRLARHSQLSVQAQKYLIKSAATGAEIPEARKTADALYREVVEGPDTAIGKNAFLAKTAPQFEWAGNSFWNPEIP